MKKILVILVCFFIWPTFALAEFACYFITYSKQFLHRHFHIRAVGLALQFLHNRAHQYS